MATPLIAGSLALLFNKHGDLSPEQYKHKLVDACIALKDTETGQGSGMLNLRLLFNSDLSTDNNTPPKSMDFGGEIFETILMFLVIIFLLDSRI